MSQEQAKTYLDAAEKAQSAATAALPALASADAALKSAQRARAVLQKTLQNATDPAQKEELNTALKQFDATVLNPAKTAFNIAKANVDNPQQSAQELREQANKASNSTDNSVNTTPLGNLAAKDAIDYPAPDPYYPKEGTSAAQIISTSTEPVRPLTAAELDMRAKVQVLEESLAQSSQRLNRAAELRGQGVSPAEAYIQAREEFPPNPLQQPTLAPVETRTPIDLENIRTREQQLVDAPLRRLPTDSTVKSQQEIDQEELSTLQNAQQEQYRREESENLANYVQDVYGGTTQARRSANATAVSMSNTKDLRVRISLAKEANYMYKIADYGDILYPLKSTNGVIFPYTPQITMSYSANYDSVDPTHSNYKIYNYKSSSVDSISIIGDFTAQDTTEANYLLAVIHFFKSVTKMFYGKDENPTKGSPPPLCYLSGYGTYAFDMHPIVISSFSLSYPNDVDYINAGASFIQGQQLTEYSKPTFPEQRGILARIAGLKRSGVAPGGVSSKNPFVTVSSFTGITRVPTKMTITLTALPIITRNNVSNYFSLRDYATGALLKNSRGYGGMW